MFYSWLTHIGQVGHMQGREANNVKPINTKFGEFPYIKASDQNS